MILLEFAGAASLALAASAAFCPALALERRGRMGALAALLPVIMLSPLVVPSGQRLARLPAAILAVALTAKLWDLHVGAGRGHRPDLRAFLAFLPNLASVVLRTLDEEPCPGRRQDRTRLLTSGLGAALGVVVVVGLFRADWRRLPFAVEHCAKVVALFLTLVPATAAGVAAWRLLGGRAREPMDRPYAARTPAEFWRRYNRPAQQFFRDDVFRALGGMRAPVRATLGTFAVSAALHEYLFDLAVGRVQGYQAAFFLLQGLAVAATRKARPRGWRAAPWVAGTVAFNLATSALFFASLDEVVPFYARRT